MAKKAKSRPINRLDDITRQKIIRMYKAGSRYSEISAELEIPAHTVRYHCLKAAEAPLEPMDTPRPWWQFWRKAA
jgi:hypothetical protein